MLKTWFFERNSVVHSELVRWRRGGERKSRKEEKRQLTTEEKKAKAHWPGLNSHSQQTTRF
jgi:hypothetical protein